MKKLAIITALHERYRLTSIFLHYYAHVLNVPGVIVHLLCAVTTNEYKMRDLLSNYLQWERVYTVNSPLTYKFAANMEGVKKFNPDAMLILGSDDFVDADFIYEGLEKCEETGFAGTNEVHYLDYGTESMIRQWSIDGRPVGAGRFLSKRLLKELDWMPWDMDNTKLDNSNAKSRRSTMHVHGARYTTRCKDEG